MPVGTQLAWQLQAQIASGELSAGTRLPGLRAAAEAADVNVNTVRAVYQRLVDQGLVTSEHGRGTFVTERAKETVALGRLAARAADEAAEAGIDPREVAAALYGSEAPAGETASGEAATAEDDGSFRRELRRQIAEYERQLLYYTRHEVGEPLPTTDVAGRKGAAALLTSAELVRVRDELEARVAELRRAEEERRLIEAEHSRLESTYDELERQDQIRTAGRGEDDSPAPARWRLWPQEDV